MGNQLLGVPLIKPMFKITNHQRQTLYGSQVWRKNTQAFLTKIASPPSSTTEFLLHVQDMSISCTLKNTTENETPVAEGWAG